MTSLAQDRSLAIITGGSSGIGLAFARQLARRGHRIALLARDHDRLERARLDLAGDGFQAVLTSVDVGDAAACRAAVEALIAEYGPPAWLITSAGDVEPGLFVSQSIATHEAQLRVNYLGTLYALHAALPAMIAQGQGHVVLISSGAGLVGIMGYGSYCPAKFAVRGLAEVLRVELAATGVCVTVSFPPDTDTPQLVRERPLRPAATATFLAGAKVFSPDAVAGHAVRTALAGRFVSAPGWPLATLAVLGTLIAPLVRAAQRRSLRRHGMHEGAK